MRLILLALVLLSQTPSERQSLAFKEACRAQVYQEARIVVPFQYPGELCYATAGDSVVCETAAERVARVKAVR
jgi:hypothetical protein